MLDNRVFASFAFYSCLLVLKMYILAVITGQVRLRRKTVWTTAANTYMGGLQTVATVALPAMTNTMCQLRKELAFANPEDAMRHGGLQYHREDAYVERCRRAHINDMENILPFLFLGMIYCMTAPTLSVARIHFLVFFLGRIVHSVAYLTAMKAPTRSLAYIIAQVPCFSMLVQILFTVFPHWW